MSYYDFYILIIYTLYIGHIYSLLYCPSRVSLSPFMAMFLVPPLLLVHLFGCACIYDMGLLKYILVDLK